MRVFDGFGKELTNEWVGMEQRIQALEDKNQGLSSQVKDLKEANREIAKLKAQIDELTQTHEGQIAKLTESYEDKINSLTTDNGKLSEEITHLKGRATKRNAEIRDLKS